MCLESNPNLDDEVNQEPTTTLSIIMTSETLPEYSYNVPSGYSQDTELLRAEALFYNTPLSEKYAESVYGVLENVQDQCAADYSRLCAPRDMGVIGIEEFLSQFLTLDINRRLTAMKPEQKTGRELLERMRSLYVRKEPVADDAVKHTIVAKADKKKLKPSTQRTVPLNLRKGPHLLNGALPLGAPRLLSESSGSTSETSGSSGSSSEERWSRHHWEPRGAVEIAPRPVPRPLPPVQQVLPQFMAIDPMPMPMYMPRERMAMPGLRREPAPALMGTASAPAGPAGPAGRPGPPGRPAWAPAPLVDDDSDDDGSDSDDDSDDEDDHHGPGHHGHGHEDTSFPGALGFGAQGDLCMYQQLEQLSPPCVSAVADVYALRQSYWAEAEGHGHHHCGGGLVLIGLLLLFLGARFISRKRRQAVQGLLVGLEADPALKAKVEESLGIQVPAPCKCPSAGQSCCKRLCTTLAVLLGTLLGSLLISISSLEVTSSIVASMDAQVDPQSGEPMPTSPGVVLAILFAVCTVHVLAVAGLVRLCKAGYQKMTRSAGASAGTGAGAVAPSAPTHVHPVADPVYSPSPAASWDLGTWFNNLRARQGIYAPLMAEDTEMVAVSSNAAPSVQVYAGVPIRANQITFTAVPVNSGNFV